MPCSKLYVAFQPNSLSLDISSTSLEFHQDFLNKNHHSLETYYLLNQMSRLFDGWAMPVPTH